ncbi:MAG: signal recognition particle-docking protein FtsY [Pseudomonadota bacterium]|nr:signal recognition particle-docking protein FtsY [Pseudomonadota bacterium]
MLDSASLVFLTILIITIITTSAFIKAYGDETGAEPAEPSAKPPALLPDPASVEPFAKVPKQPTIAKPPPSVGLAKTKRDFWQNIGGLFKRNSQINDALLEELHEVLYRADVGNRTVDLLIDKCRTELQGKDIELEQLLTVIRAEASEIMATAVATEEIQPKTIILVVGINGVGKTTTIGKLAHHFQKQGQSVLLCAADTFRAAAIDQLQVWADRLKTSLIKRPAGSDAGAVVYDALQNAKKQNTDILLIDTAGRLHNKDDLMAELQKLKKIASKNASEYRLETWIVLDATTGQNAIRQVEAFLALVDITGIVITKLDGTAKGGIIIAVCDKFKIPLRFVGIGEQAHDLQPFQPHSIAKQMF